MKIGFIGLGLMGRPMALNLLAAGHELHVWARRTQSLQPFADRATQHATPAALAAQVDVLITMVADAPDVESVIFGKDGAASGARAGLIHIDMSTIAPAAAMALAKREAEHGMVMLDAPVSGGETGAIQGTLTIMVGGDEAAFAKMQPVLASMGKQVTLIGKSGAGQVAKACNQILTGVGVVAVAEALNFSTQLGVDAGAVRAAISAGFARSKILDNHGQRMLDDNFKPGFKAWMHDKDMRIVLEHARSLGLALPASRAAAEHFEATVQQGWGELDSIAVLQTLRKHSVGNAQAQHNVGKPIAGDLK